MGETMSISCGESIYDPDKSDRVTIDCELVMTPFAATQLQTVMTEAEPYLYLTVKGGGCSGYIYEMDLLGDEPTDNHQIINSEGVKIIIHNLDSGLLTGIIIDYEDKLMGGGFTIKNPNATRTCGCGLSFK